MNDPFGKNSIGNAVFVCVTQFRGQKGVSGKTVPDVDIARGFWKFKPADLVKAQQCEVLVAIERSVVVGAWKIPLGGWNLGFSGAIPTRLPLASYANRYWCTPIDAFDGLKIGSRIDGPFGPGPMCGRSYLFN